MKAYLIDPQKLRLGRGRPGSRFWFENSIKEEKLERVVADGPDTTRPRVSDSELGLKRPGCSARTELRRPSSENDMAKFPVMILTA